MKAKFENLLFINYCISKPFNVLLVLIIGFFSILIIDQCALSKSSKPVKKPGDEISSTSSVTNSEDNYYLAWVSSQPGIIKYFDKNICSNDTNSKAISSIHEGLINNIKVQILTFKRIVEFTER